MHPQVGRTLDGTYPDSSLPHPIRHRSATMHIQGMDTPHAVPRARAAEMIGRKPGTLRAWSAQSPPRGPRPTKTGTAKQARTLYPVDEIRDWLSDPVASEAQRRPPNVPRG